MSFNTDKQTLDDLNIIGRPGGNSIYNLFNDTHTRGGAEILEQMFLYPLSDELSINNRSQTIQYFKSAGITFPFKTEFLDSAELYFGMTDQRTMLSHGSNNIGTKLGNLISADGDYKQIYNGIAATIDILHDLKIFIDKTSPSAGSISYHETLEEMTGLISDPDLADLFNEKRGGKLSYTKVVDYDHLLRLRFRLKLKKLLTAIYELDVYISVARIALKHNFVFPGALDKGLHTVILENVYHPLVKDAVANVLHITLENNIVFLTGANMAGKSTFMKSIGIAMYLAHIGFPVAAEKMEFSVQDGLYTTINLPDDLDIGNSHFYAEVLRVKKVAKELGKDKNLFIIFDELFRGTNVKDAYEATIAITEAFAQKRNCMFVVSTHIIEAGDVLKERCDNINFTFLPTLMEDNKPVYTYKLESGITNDRHGMVIINNEGILDILERKKNKAPETNRFVADKQTLDDLNMLGRFKGNSVSRLFDRVVTSGGKKLLDDMFRQPFSDAREINERCNIFQYFGNSIVPFPFTNEEFSEVEDYLSSGNGNNLIGVGMGVISKKLLHVVAQDKDYNLLKQEVRKTIIFLNVFYDFMEQLKEQDITNPFFVRMNAIKKIFNHNKLGWLKKGRDLKEISLFKMIRYDHLLREDLHEEMNTLMDVIYHLDVYIAVSAVARERGFCYPHALPKADNVIEVAGLYHPAVENAVSNSLSFHQDHNVLFLTGANMAGKSTLMKSFGICMYLAHMGFPVAAEKMEFSVKDSLFSSINVPDNISMGYSHFYAEVLRVKKVAEEVSSGKDLIVIFDELFKGTNVKDAYDATLAVTQAFSKYKNCFFIISTHITEVGETLREQDDHLQFVYLPTLMEDTKPRYTYKLQKGITTDRQGMIIIENEGIIELIKNAE